MACYKSALIDLDRRWANKGQEYDRCYNNIQTTKEIRNIVR